MEMAKVTSKGQITIPVSIRRKLQIKEGDKLLFIDRPEGVVMVNPDMLPGERSEVKAPRPAKSAPAEAASDYAETPGPEASAPVEEAADRAGSPGPDVSQQAKEDADNAETLESDVSAPVEEAVTDNREAPPTDTVPESTGSQLQGLDLKELLNEIRNIGSKI